MEGDTVILVAFCLFVLLVGFRLRQRYWQPQELRCPEQRSRFRLIFTIIQLVVLGGLIIYMVRGLRQDFNAFDQVRGIDFFLRCLIFVFTIYIFVSGVKALLRQKNKEEAEK